MTTQATGWHADGMVTVRPKDLGELVMWKLMRFHQDARVRLAVGSPRRPTFRNTPPAREATSWYVLVQPTNHEILIHGRGAAAGPDGAAAVGAPLSVPYPADRLSVVAEPFVAEVRTALATKLDEVRRAERLARLQPGGRSDG